MSDPNATQAGRALSVKKFWLLGVLIVGLALFFLLDFDRFVTVDALRSHRSELTQFVAANMAVAIILYMSTYALLIAFSLPVGAILTILGGFLFGTVSGGSAAVLAATVGATALFLAAKTALSEPLRARAGPILRKMEDGIRADALNYLLVLRLVPIFPFFLVNMAAGLLGMRLRDYLLATFFGIMPGGLVYASVGNGLGAVFDSGGEPNLGIIFQPEVLLPLVALALLALVPVAHKRFKRRKAVRQPRDPS